MVMLSSTTIRSVRALSLPEGLAARPTGDANPGTAPIALISSSVAGRSSRAPTALASLVSFNSRSPRMTAKMNCSRVEMLHAASRFAEWLP